MPATLWYMLREGTGHLLLRRVGRARPETTANRILVVGLLLALATVCAQTTAHLIDFGVYGLRLRALDSGLDTSIFAWVADAALGAAGVGAVLIAVTTRRAAPALLAALLFALFVASLGGLRDREPHALLLLAPLVAAILLLLWRESLQAPQRAGRFLRAGAVLLVVSFCLHVLGPSLLTRFGVRPASWPFEIKVALKQGSEIAGWMITATGFAAVSQIRRFKRRRTWAV
jgi:hypothetical protein